MKDATPIRAMGIDCGTEFTGFAIVEKQGKVLLRIASGSIVLHKSLTFAERLDHIHRTLCSVIMEHRPACVAIEEVFYSVNAKSALKLGHVRGVALLAAANCKLPIAEYSPLSVKSAVVGYGRAEKQQVQQMVARLLALKEIPESEDEADALAIAICHLHTSATLMQHKKVRA